MEQSERFQKNPPILFQLLSLRDIEKESGTAGLVFDAVLNIMLCLSYLNGRHTALATKYFGIYFDRIIRHITKQDLLSGISRRIRIRNIMCSCIQRILTVL